MKVLIICACLAVFASAKPLDALAITPEQVANLPQEVKNMMGQMIVILSDTSASKDDKMKKIQDLVKDAPAEAKAQVAQISQKVLEFGDWLAERAKTASPEVQAIFPKLGQLSSVEFLSLPDDQKAKKVEEITGTLNAAQKAELEQIGKESEAKLHALGLKK